MPNKFKPMKARFRATFAAGAADLPRFEKIDKEAEVLYGVQITLEGEAKGHGVFLDREFCEAVAAQGNKAGDAGIKVRFGHPAMCSDALGTYLGRAKNFRVAEVERKLEDGSTVKVAGVLADIHIASESHSAPTGDLGKWVLEAAENSPDTFGQSIVFTYADWVVKDADGARHSYREEVSDPFDAWLKENEDASYESKSKKSSELYDAWMAKSADGKFYAVLGHLLGTDFTDTPAATDGVFSSTDLASQAEKMLEENPEIVATLKKEPAKVLEFLDRMGLTKGLESARVAGLQAAKDKEIAALKAKIGELEARPSTASLEESLAAKTAELASMADSLSAKDGEIENLKKDLAKNAEALAAHSFESVEQLLAKYGETSKALSETKAALEVETERYREQVGAAFTLKPEGKELTGRARAVAALSAKA